MEKLIAITDLGRVRILKFLPGGDDPGVKDHLKEVVSDVMDGVGDPLRETVSDQAGQFGGHGGTGGSSGEEHNLEGEMQRQALQRVAARVAEFVESEGCPTWTLVAPQAILKRLTEELPQPCKNSITNSVAADLTKVPLAKLEDRFLR